MKRSYRQYVGRRQSIDDESRQSLARSQRQHDMMAKGRAALPPPTTHSSEMEALISLMNTPEQVQRIFDDPSARTKFLNYLKQDKTKLDVVYSMAKSGNSNASMIINSIQAVNKV